MSVICNKVGKEKRAQPTTATTSYDPADPVRLVKEAADGNFTAFGELYSIFLDRIYRYVFFQVRDKMTAEDITEEVFIKAWSAIRSCRGREKTFLTWLYRIAHNHLINTLYCREKPASLEKNNLVEIMDPKQKIEMNIECQELLETITCLPQNQKQVIILKFIEGLDNREIGRIMSKNEGAIRVSQMRALTTLREKLGDRGNGNEK
jgi:RNA polymerase sigma-70 factor (ECF subfamily)